MCSFLSHQPGVASPTRVASLVVARVPPAIQDRDQATGATLAVVTISFLKVTRAMVGTCGKMKRISMKRHSNRMKCRSDAKSMAASLPRRMTKQSSLKNFIYVFSRSVEQILVVAQDCCSSSVENCGCSALALGWYFLHRSYYPLSHLFGSFLFCPHHDARTAWAKYVSLRMYSLSIFKT